jgi:hypothetical protein
VKNILSITNQNLVVRRINLLSVDSQKLWGKMNVGQMICHCTDQIKMAEGKFSIDFAGSLFLTKVMKNLILLGLPAPKGKVKTYKELDQFKKGTKPTTFDNDRKLLISVIKNFENEYPAEKSVLHPSFGKMDKSQWGRLIYIHLDHHLKQFGV